MRNEFYQNLEDILTKYQFIKNDNKYTLEETYQKPGQTMIINGQRIDQLPTPVLVKKEVTVIGDGSVSNEDGSNEQGFTQIELNLFVSNEPNGTLHEAFMWDDINYFNKVLTEFINM